MAWWAWILLAVNVSGYIVAWRWNAYGFAHEFGKPDPDDVIMGVLFGGLVAIVWPLCLLYHFGGTDRVGGFLMSPPPRAKRRLLEERIRELERQTGMR